jgi:hypothetical protein
MAHLFIADDRDVWTQPLVGGDGILIDPEP